MGVSFGMDLRDLFDEDYWESYGVREAGLTAFGGITLKY